MKQDTVFNFHNRVAVVIGASGGIGKATALELAKYGADIVVAARRAEELEHTASEISRLGRNCLQVPTNVRRKEDIKALIDNTMSKFGRIDFLVNTAGTSPQVCELINLEEWAWDVLMNTNVKANFLLSQAVAKVMIRQGGGAIVFVSGIAGLQPEGYMGALSISKAALMHLTRVLAGELGPHNIRVNAIAPGLTRTELARGYWENEAVLRNYLNICASKRIAEPEEQAKGIVYLLSDYASYVNGHILVIDGGREPMRFLDSIPT
jgi:NAD(P)-dependent dehydrogenase (short-subunit alcohol dehydrogenase family)